MQTNLIKPITATFILAVAILACSHVTVQPDEPIKAPPSTAVIPTPPIVEQPTYYGFSQMYAGYAVSGSISANAKADPIMPAVSQKADISTLRATGSTGELNYIAIGSNLTSGYRDGGLTREAQLTAYPNLIAHQMGLTNFKSPLFDVKEANGSGGLVFDGTVEMPSWKQISNQTAIKTDAPMTMNKYTGGDFQNISSPFMLKGWFGDDFLVRTYGFHYPFAERMASTTVNPLMNQLNKKSPDIYTIEFGLDSYLNYIMTQKSCWFSSYGELGDYKLSDKMKGKPVWLLMPSQLLQFPYFQFFTYEKLIKKLGVSSIQIGTYKDQDVEFANKNCIFLPTKRIMDAINNKTPLGIVPDVEVLDAMETQSAGLNTQYGVTEYNYYLSLAAKTRNVPTVDLPNVYDKILKGQYISEDGFKIDPSFPKGNFFSQDGLYPSAIGQAVIANEVIKVMNKSYNSNIPLINLTVYARGLK